MKTIKSITKLRYPVGLITFFIIIYHSVAAQNGASKPVQAMEKVNQKTQQGVQMTSQMAGQVNQISDNIKQVYDNVKGMVKVFEPILKFRLWKKKPQQAGQEATAFSQQQPTQTNTPDQQNYNTSQTSSSPYDQQSVYPSDNTNTSYPVSAPMQDNASPSGLYPGNSTNTQPFVDYNSSSSNVTSYDIMQNVPLMTQSPAYNTDGTANFGSQNHTQYGCYLDILRGAVMDDIDAAGNSKSVDLIFTATDYYGSAPMYAFLTPSYVKNDFFSNYYFRGAKYKDANIPPKQWTDVNESEIALTPYTGTQFDKIQTNDQLMAVVKQCSGFKDKFESRTKIEGKVFAIKTEIDSRTAYGLLYVVNHYGTTGANGYLKIKLKVTGYDANGDGNPDANLYNMPY